MLLQTHSYLVPKEHRAEHLRLLSRFRQLLTRLGCEHFEAYEQVGNDWDSAQSAGRFVQIMRFRDRRHQQQVQHLERTDPGAQALVKEFCELINYDYQQGQGLFVVGYYNGLLPACGMSHVAAGLVADPTLTPEAGSPMPSSSDAPPPLPALPPTEPQPIADNTAEVL